MDQEMYYTPAETAKEQLKARASLRPFIEQFWEEKGWGKPPETIMSTPAPAILARQLATFRFEDALFSSMATRAGMTPVWPAYEDDVFSSHSKLKRSYLRPRFVKGRNKHGEIIVHGDALTSHGHAGTALKSIALDKKDGINLPEYHYRVQDKAFPNAIRCDISSWYSKIEHRERYEAMMSMFMAHGVLFEDYHGGESGEALSSLTIERFEPAFHKLTAMFEFKPLVVKLPWWQELSFYCDDADWQRHGIIPDEYLTW